MEPVDVVVAGGGVAGLLIASALAPSFSVVLLEQQPSIPRNKYWLTDDESATLNPDLERHVDARYRFLDFIAYDGLKARIHGSYALWNTDALTSHLAASVEASGGRILTDHRFFAFSYERRWIVLRANSLTIRSRILIDCMGFGSPIVGAKDVARITGYYVMHGCEVRTRAAVDPIGLDNVILNRRPTYFELFPTSRGTAHAAIILPSRHYRVDRTIKVDLNFILERSHYRDAIEYDRREAGPAYYGIIPVGRLKRVALDRIVFFGESGQSNPAASATGLTRMLRTYRAVATALSDCLRRDAVDGGSLVAAIPPAMSPANRLFQECLFESLLDFNSDRYRQLVLELRQCPDEIVYDLIFANLEFASRKGIRLTLGALSRPVGLLGRNVLLSAVRRLARHSGRA
jgi:flavin-dependent dehydrogenase